MWAKLDIMNSVFDKPNIQQNEKIEELNNLKNQVKKWLQSVNWDVLLSVLEKWCIEDSNFKANVLKSCRNNLLNLA